MKLITYSKLTIALLSIVVLLNSCAKKGDPGPVGDQGTKGAGFDEAAKNGSITLYITGTTPAGTAFQDTILNRFAPGDLYYSHVENNDGDLQFYLKRYQGYSNSEGEGDSPNFSTSLELQVDGSDTTFYFDSHLETSITTPSFTYINLYEYFYNTDGQNFEELQIEGLKYDEATGHLYFRFRIFSNEGQNGTSHDLTINGVVDVTVYKSM